MAPRFHTFTKKSRTPRDKNSKKHAPMVTFNPLHIVPEIETDEPVNINRDEQFNYQVPVFDPLSSEWFQGDKSNTESDGLILPSDSEVAEFAADMERLLGKSHDNEVVACGLNEPVKVEDENCELVCDGYDHVNVYRDMFYDNIRDMHNKTMNMLKLDYNGIIAGWDDERSPWTTGNPPELDPKDCMVGSEEMRHCESGDMGSTTTRLDAGREARVSRYKKKRQTRLFSKKIRYEVRKLNAEKRPRIKGRFVKRTSFAA
ncbi:putative transcription factor C2C2-CO-like family [Helianthus annuus]|nr:putative transcription factor C2C2-CO-like family [Helianthus annuus]